MNKIKDVIGEIKSALTAAWDYVKSLAERLKTMVKGWVDKVYTFVNSLIKKAMKVVYTIKDKVTKFAKDAFEGIKKLGTSIQSLWGEIKKLPQLILKLVDAAIEGVLKLLDVILKPIAKVAKQDYNAISTEAESNCAWCRETPVVGPLCLASQKVTLTVWNIFASLVDKGIHLIFTELGKIANNAFTVGCASKAVRLSYTYYNYTAVCGVTRIRHATIDTLCCMCASPRALTDISLYSSLNAIS